MKIDMPKEQTQLLRLYLNWILGLITVSSVRLIISEVSWVSGMINLILLLFFAKIAMYLNSKIMMLHKQISEES